MAAARLPRNRSAFLVALAVSWRVGAAEISRASGGLLQAHKSLAADTATTDGASTAKRTLHDAVEELAAKALALRYHSVQEPDGGILEEIARGNLTHMFLLNGYEIVIQVILGLVLLIIFGFLYKKYRSSMLDAPGENDNGKPEELDGEWKYGFWDCCSTPKMCCISCCFPAVRWADTIDMAGQLSFWVAVAVYWALSLCNLFVGAIFAIATGILGAYYRQKLRGIFSIPNCTPKTICLDFVAYCCCPCIAIVQEGRTLEEARRVDHKGVREGFMEQA